MTNIKEILPEAAIGKLDRKQPTAPRAPDESRPEKIQEESKQRDLLQVDEKRRDETRLVENAKLLLEELPDVRSDRVEQARQRLENGFYDRPEVLDQTAGKLLESESPEGLTQLRNVSVADENSNVQKVQTSQDRLSSGYYEQDGILDKTAQRILKENP